MGDRRKENYVFSPQVAEAARVASTDDVVPRCDGFRRHDLRRAERGGAVADNQVALRGYGDS